MTTRQPKTVRHKGPEQRVAGKHLGRLVVFTAAAGNNVCRQEGFDCSTALDCQAQKGRNSGWQESTLAG